jgi:hypothetical protein
MNEQQLAAVKQALEALEKSLPRLAPYGEQDWLDSCKAITALQSIISQDAPKSMANNGGKTGWPPGMLQDDSRELSKWLASKPDARKNVREAMEDAIKGGVGIMLGGKRIDPDSIYAEPKIGCVNHDCDKCKAVQEWMKPHPKCDEACLFQCTKGFTQFPECAAAQPVPVKTYHDGKPWPVAPKPWVGLTETEVEAYDSWADFQVGCGRQTLFDMVRDIEAKLKEKNHG